MTGISIQYTFCSYLRQLQRNKYPGETGAYLHKHEFWAAILSTDDVGWRCELWYWWWMTRAYSLSIVNYHARARVGGQRSISARDGIYCVTAECIACMMRSGQWEVRLLKRHARFSRVLVALELPKVWAESILYWDTCHWICELNSHVFPYSVPKLRRPWKLPFCTVLRRRQRSGEILLDSKMLP